nr:uncharacterized protein LOC116424998 isoform X1 [Nomia melanderi]XP_031828015.1 uncharacterized protein LOC116424998 isoform X1 [Nomia melanderi]
MDTDLEFEQIEGHIENRNQILSELQEICKKNSCNQIIDLDTCNEMGGKQESSLSFVEDILIEMNGKSLKKFNELRNAKCYRCKHFQNIPRNILEDSEKASNLTERYEADLMFIQAIVWLKSLTRIMKDISHEQFRLVFHKQWNTALHKRDDAEADNKNIRSQSGRRTKSPNPILSFNVIQERDLTLYNSRDRIDIESSNNTEHKKKHSIIQFGRDAKQNGEHFPRTTSTPSNSSSRSTRSFIRSLTENALPNHIIPDSQSEYSSCSDIFKDSSRSEDARTASQNRIENQLPNEDSMNVESIELPSFQSQELPYRSDSSQTIIPESKSDLSVNSAKVDSIDIFNGKSSLYGESVDNSQGEDKWPSKLTMRRMTQNSKTSDSRFCINKLTISSNHTDQHSMKDENAISNSRDCFTPRRKSSVLDSFEFPANVDEEEWILDGNRKSSLSSLELSLRRCDGRVDSTQVIQSSQVNLMEGVGFGETRGKRRKMENEGKRISSRWLRFTLEALNTDDVAFQSMKVILSVLLSEKLAVQYMRSRCWKNTLEMQAVNAVLDFSEIFEMEKKSNACTNEIVLVITQLLDRSIRNVELNKVTILTHRISIILELCASMGVCIEIINYLTAKLKCYESILISLTNSRKANVHGTANQLHIIFYSLSICLGKYLLVFTNKPDNQFEEETTLSVVELWKKQLKFEGVILQESIQARERRWQMILNDFSTIAMETFVPFTKMSRRLLNILMR